MLEEYWIKRLEGTSQLFYSLVWLLELQVAGAVVPLKLRFVERADADPRSRVVPSDVVQCGLRLFQSLEACKLFVRASPELSLDCGEPASGSRSVQASDDPSGASDQIDCLGSSAVVASVERHAPEDEGFQLVRPGLLCCLQRHGELRPRPVERVHVHEQHHTDQGSRLPSGRCEAISQGGSHGVLR